MKHPILKPKMVLSLGACLALSLVPQAVALSALDEWNSTARDALSAPVKVWLGLMMLTNIAALGFLKNHVAARWVFGGFLISHGLVMVMWAQGIQVLAGQVSLFHIIFWMPGALMLLHRREEIRYPSAYSVWATLSLIFFFGSMLVDVRDAFIFLQSLV